MKCIRLLIPLALIIALAPAAAQERAVTVTRIVRVGDDRPRLPQVEPVVAVQPTDSSRLAAAVIVAEHPDRDDFGDSLRIEVLVSQDGGTSWTRHSLPETSAGRAMGDPWLGWAKDGALYLSALVRDDRRRMATWLFRSLDGGRSWNSLTQVPFPTTASQDHPVLDVASPAGGPGLTLFATAALEGIAASLSSTGMTGFRPATLFSPNQENNNLGSGLSLIGGRLLFTYYSMSRGIPTPLWAVFSGDAGKTWTRAQVTARHVPVGFPMIAEDRSAGPHRGRVYCVWVPTEDEANVVVSRSDDGGATWSAPVIVHRDRSRVLRARPAITVNGKGYLAVSWTDGRHSQEGGNACWDVYAAVSTDGGDTFLPEVRLTAAPSCAAAAGNGAAGRRWRWGGDYAGITADHVGRFQVIWSDSRSGVFQPWLATLVVESKP